MCFLHMNRTTIMTTFIYLFFFSASTRNAAESHIDIQIYCKPAYKHKPEKRVNIKSKTTTYLLTANNISDCLQNDKMSLF